MKKQNSIPAGEIIEWYPEREIGITREIGRLPLLETFRVVIGRKIKKQTEIPLQMPAITQVMQIPIQFV